METCAYEVSAGRNIETAEPVIIISHPLTSLPKCLSFVFLCPSSSSSRHILIHVTGGTTETPISVC